MFDYPFGSLFTENDWMQQNSENINDVKIKLVNFTELLSRYCGSEFITEKSIGKSFKLYSYLVKYERQPIRFIFVFYKPNDKWVIYNSKYDQELTEELEDAAKAYWLKENIDY